MNHCTAALGRERSFRAVPVVAGPAEYYGKQNWLSAVHEGRAVTVAFLTKPRSTTTESSSKKLPRCARNACCQRTRATRCTDHSLLPNVAPECCGLGRAGVPLLEHGTAYGRNTSDHVPNPGIVDLTIDPVLAAV